MVGSHNQKLLLQSRAQSHSAMNQQLRVKKTSDSNHKPFTYTVLK